MFQGASALTLDAKGRMSIPSRYREALQGQAAGRVTVTKHPDGCLLLFPFAEWENFRSKIVALPMDAQWWRRIFLGNASEVELDGANRVLLAPELRKAAALDKEVMLLGMGACFEIWDARTYEAKEQAAMMQEMPAALKNFTF
ncbi:MAG: MraZ protein [Glomeribacter sp. 1016415]|uniref:Transcriptional regulator MraZ n=1 Tax=Mycoavidus cysteinexigens TaxID=1553431 RepID=A0A2Z6EXT8_9BURK|nr:division/cell wall cluster transcriptional repressor MraZ [Mycoavidus cysteinexigens]MCX8566366.1 MraZ protein [Glomeribacter sp. 1016415]BBE10212.1 cell division protein MraZ [Mycoavidus cysteinexigens]GAM53426.1 cell division protein MraZ [bacterium endosymbiont of Mortierella elongata FMR23-6]GLR00629.1 transcriptional regulator MraZ [Mycoavidus cysteinexigens]